MRLIEIRRFPVKSMLGETPRGARVETSGVVGDRAHALVDIETGKVASAKRPRLWGSLLEFSAYYNDHPGAGEPLVIALPDGTALHSEQPDFDERLSGAIGRQVKLVAAPEQGAGYEDEWLDIEGMAPQEFIQATQTSTSEDGNPVSTLPVGMMAPGTFQDVAPVTIMTTAALRRAGELQPGSQWDPRRFRPNLLLEVEGTGFIENEWVGRQLRVGEVVFSVAAPIPRCVMTTLPQEDLSADREILRTVARHNRVDVAGTGVFACLGAYAGILDAGRVAVGDEIEVL
jgi:uncharacterized protein YcbX